MRTAIHLIREMLESDLDEVSKISEDCGFFTWKKVDYEGELSRAESFTLVAERENVRETGKQYIDGFLLARLITPDVELLNIAVKENCRKSGVGTLLLAEFINKCYEKEIVNIWLEVRESNDAAIKFYFSRGFKTVGKRNSYYKNPVEDALLMSYRFDALKDDA